MSYELLDKPVELTCEKLCSLTMENTIEFRRILESFLSGEDRVCFFKDNEPLKPKDVLFVEDILSIDLNDRKMATKIHKLLEEMMLLEDFILKTNEINGLLSGYMEELIFETDLPLMVSEDFDRQTLIKAMGIQVIDESDSFVERIMDYLNLILSFIDYKLIVFVNLLIFLDDGEVRELIDYGARNEIMLVTIERVNVSQNYDKKIREILFDKDLCRVL